MNRITRTYTQHIDAPPGDVFPLICPVREAEWLDGWTYEWIHSVSGFAELGCVFRTQPLAEPETIWIITQHDPAAGLIEFVRVTAGFVATRLEVRVEPADGASLVHITYDFSPTSEAGVRLVNERQSPEAFRASMEWWERSMNHFIRTGTTLRRT
jgi:hypothetical protein